MSQLSRFAGRQRPNEEFTTGVCAGTLQELFEEGLGIDVFRAKTSHQHQQWSIRGPQQSLEQKSTVGVSPLQVVDVDHQGLAIRDAPQQLSQCAEGLPPQVE